MTEPLIDRLSKWAGRVQWLFPFAVLIAVACAIAAGVIILSSTHHADDRYLLPALVGLLWSLNACAFIVGFRTVPGPAEGSDGGVLRIRHGMRRARYRLLALAFVGTTVAVIVITFKLLSLWWREF